MSWRRTLGSSAVSWVGPPAGPAAASCTPLPAVSTAVLDEPSEDSICFDDGFLRSIIVSNESSEGSIISSDGKECSLKTGKVGDAASQRLGPQRSEPGGGQRGGQERQWFRVSRSGSGPQDESAAQHMEHGESGEASVSHLWSPQGENWGYLSTPNLLAHSPRLALPVWPACFPVAVRNSQPINSVGRWAQSTMAAGTWQAALAASFHPGTRAWSILFPSCGRPQVTEVTSLCHPKPVLAGELPWGKLGLAVRWESLQGRLLFNKFRGRGENGHLAAVLGQRPKIALFPPPDSK